MRAVLLFSMALLLVSSVYSLASDDQLELASIDRELIEMAEKDQAVRKNYNFTEMLRLGKLNSICLKEIIKQYGWPDSKRFSKGANEGAWLILQHASHDQALQREGLELMKLK